MALNLPPAYITGMKPTYNKLQIIMTTHDDLAQAEQLARLLVDSRSAACVNLLPNVVSVFRWEGETQSETEIMMLIKTTLENTADVQAIIEAHHSYDVPEIVRLSGEVLHEPYMQWIRDCLAL
ncbi:MAG: divalent-cation tolerance protein CutA [Candidatus Marinimicrobia bacterium]|nr:divalent-cation tolerance protein CutA [Candidatus Neomarinimicrobiota bacterium]